jgi:hypothetical protein
VFWRDSIQPHRGGISSRRCNWIWLRRGAPENAGFTHGGARPAATGRHDPDSSFTPVGFVMQLPVVTAFVERTMSDAKDKLVHFLEHKAFRPVMDARPDRYPASKRDTLQDMQRRTQSEIDRFRGYGSAHEVVVNFKRDLSSEPAKKVHRALHDLGLPTVEDVRDDFEKLAEELHVR